MKKFNAPCMERVDLVRQNIVAASLCNNKYCDGFTCPKCEGDLDCPVQTGCEAHKCGHYQCPTYDI